MIADVATRAGASIDSVSSATQPIEIAWASPIASHDLRRAIGCGGTLIRMPHSNATRAFAVRVFAATKLNAPFDAQAANG